MRHSMHTNHTIFLAMFRILNSNFNDTKKQKKVLKYLFQFRKIVQKEMEHSVHSTIEKNNKIDLKSEIHRLLLWTNQFAFSCREYRSNFNDSKNIASEVFIWAIKIIFGWRWCVLKATPNKIDGKKR